MAAPEHGSGHETSCFWGWHVPKCFATRRHVPPAARPHVATRQRIQEYICCQSESPSAHGRCGAFTCHTSKKDSRLPGIALSRDGRSSKILENAQRWPGCCKSTHTMHGAVRIRKVPPDYMTSPQLCVSGSGCPDVSVARVRFVFQVSLASPGNKLT